MKKVCITLFFLVSLFLSAQDKKNHFYHLKVISSSKASVHCFVNGFPVFDILSFSRAANTIPIDLYLAGTNTLEITLDGKIEEISVDGDISPYEESEMADAMDNKPGIAPFKLEGKNKKTNVIFKTDANDFSYLIKSGPVIKSEQEVMEYAKYLLELLKVKDRKKLSEEMKPKFRDYSKVYNAPEEAFVKEFSLFFDDKFDTQEDLNKKNPELIEIVPMCEKRIYRLFVDKKDLLTRANYSIPVFVALVDGKLKIVR